MTDRLLLLDTASLYFRAFHGVPDTVSAPDGTPVNAVRGLLDMIARLVTLYEPTRLVACWDDDWRPQWRVDLIPSYKAHRVADAEGGEEMPDALAVQVPIIREALSTLGVAVAGAPGYEADDVIGTLATRARTPVDVVTGDRDLFQLVDDGRGVRIVYTARGMSRLEVVTDEVVVSRYGVRAAQYADFAVLRGDASDGLPGVPGVGEKTAAALLRDHADLTGVLAAAERGEGMTAGVRAKVLAARDYLAVAPRVVEVVRDLPLVEPSDLLEAPVGESLERARALADAWALGSSMDRALTALAEAAGRSR